MAHRDVYRPKSEYVPRDHGADLRSGAAFEMDALPRILDAGVGKDGHVRPLVNPLSRTFCQQHIRHVRNYTKTEQLDSGKLLDALFRSKLEVEAERWLFRFLFSGLRP